MIHYTIDQSAQYKGNPDGWHKSLDILLGRDEWPLQKKKSDMIYGGETKTCWRVEFRNQTLAQIIVFSFLQKQTHPLLDHFLVLCIAATFKEIEIYFYDSNYDILLDSRGMNCSLIFWEQKVNHSTTKATLAEWLVVNYRFLCSGPHKSLLQVPKARFCEHAWSCIDIYEKELSIKRLDQRELLPTLILLISWRQTLFVH